MSSSSAEFRLKSLEIIDKYLALLAKQEEELFEQLNLLLKYDREVTDNDEWNDKTHYSFTENFILAVQSKTLATVNSYTDAIDNLKMIRQQYSLISN